MNFIDKLEMFLLRPRAKVYYNIDRYKNGPTLFSLGCYRNNYGTQDKEVKKKGILAMMHKLRDSTYKHPEYTYFHLDLIVWEYFNDILTLDPTNEDLFNLYKNLGCIKYSTLNTFLKIIKDKDWKIKFFKFGQDYRIGGRTWQGDSAHLLKNSLYYLQDLNLQDDEWIELLQSYLNNSIGLKEAEDTEELIEICIACIKDNNKCELFIQKNFNENINLSTLFIENKVTQLKIDSKNIIKHFNYSDNSTVETTLDALYMLMTTNLKEIGHISQLDYYKNNTEYNFIIYNDQDDKGIEIIKSLINQILPILKNENLNKSKNEEIIKNLNDKFVKILSYVKLSMEAPQKEVNKKVIKL